MLGLGLGAGKGLNGGVGDPPVLPPPGCVGFGDGGVGGVGLGLPFVIVSSYSMVVHANMIKKTQAVKNKIPDIAGIHRMQ